MTQQIVGVVLQHFSRLREILHRDGAMSEDLVGYRCWDEHPRLTLKVDPRTKRSMINRATKQWALASVIRWSNGFWVLRFVCWGRLGKTWACCFSATLVSLLGNLTKHRAIDDDSEGSRLKPTHIPWPHGWPSSQGLVVNFHSKTVRPVTTQS